MAQLVKNPSAGDPGSIPGLGRSPGEGKLPTPLFWPRVFHEVYTPWGHKELDRTKQLSFTFPLPRAIKNLPANAGDVRDMGLIPGLERSPGEDTATHSSILA